MTAIAGTTFIYPISRLHHHTKIHVKEGIELGAQINDQQFLHQQQMPYCY